MKNLAMTAVLFLLFIVTSNAQQLEGSVENGPIKYGEVSMEITVDSLEEIESVFKLDDLKSLISETESDEKMSFKITCNGDTNSSGTKNRISYEVFGESNEPKAFIASVKKILKSAKNYYKNK